MKPVTALLLLSLAATGAACSDTVTAAPAEAEVTPAAAGGEVQGTLNLNIGRAGDGAGRQIVGSGAGAASGGLIVGPDSTGGNFEGVQDLGIEIEEAPVDPLAQPAPKSDEDELIRIPEKH